VSLCDQEAVSEWKKLYVNLLGQFVLYSCHHLLCVSTDIRLEVTLVTAHARRRTNVVVRVYELV
jgi:hypothetical protein